FGGLHTLKRRKERSRFKAVDASIYLLNLTLFRCSVLLLNYLLKTPVIISHDPPVARWVFQSNSQHCARCAAPAMCTVLLNERAQSFSANEWHIAGENQKRRACLTERIARGHDGVARAALLGLSDEDRAMLAKFLAH